MHGHSNDRDKRILAWIAEQYAVRFDHLQYLLSRDPRHRNVTKALGPNGVTNSDVLQVISRWEREPQWAEYKRIYV